MPFLSLAGKLLQDDCVFLSVENFEIAPKTCSIICGALPPKYLSEPIVFVERKQKQTKGGLTLSSRRAYVRRHKKHRFWRGAYQRRPEEIGLFQNYTVCCPQ